MDVSLSQISANARFLLLIGLWKVLPVFSR
jgi:hypothetical protein